MTTATEIQQETRAAQCDTHGPYESTRLAMPGRGGLPWTGCPGCIEHRQRQEQAKEAAEREAARFRRSGVPLRHRHCTLENFNTTTEPQRTALAAVREYVDTFSDNLTTGRCLLLYGSTGTGKTHLACAVVSALTRAGRRAHYTTVADALGRIRATWRGGGSTETEREVLDYYRGLDLLVLDEVGVQLGTDAERVQVTNLVDARYRDLKPTLVITNCTRAQLKEYLGDRVLSRLREAGGRAVVFDWDDQRGRLA